MWSFVALEAEIANPDDFKSTFIGDTPVVIGATEAGVFRRGLTAVRIGARLYAGPRAATPEAMFASIINGATILAATCEDALPQRRQRVSGNARRFRS